MKLSEKQKVAELIASFKPPEKETVSSRIDELDLALSMFQEKPPPEGHWLYAEARKSLEALRRYYETRQSGGNTPLAEDSVKQERNDELAAAFLVLWNEELEKRKRPSHKKRKKWTIVKQDMWDPALNGLKYPKEKIVDYEGVTIRIPFEDAKGMVNAIIDGLTRVAVDWSKIN